MTDSRLALPVFRAGEHNSCSMWRPYRSAASHVGAAEDALRKTLPDPADYPQGEEVYARAVVEHARRISKLQALRNEMMELLIHIHDGA
jgi:hypothetical protein